MTRKPDPAHPDGLPLHPVTRPPGVPATPENSPAPAEDPVPAPEPPRPRAA